MSLFSYPSLNPAAVVNRMRQSRANRSRDHTLRKTSEIQFQFSKNKKTPKQVLIGIYRANREIVLVAFAFQSFKNYYLLFLFVSVWRKAIVLVL